LFEVLGRRVAGPGRAILEAAERTPPHRERHADLLRALAITAVVTGHWLATVVTYADGRFGGGSVLETVPWTRALSWLFQVMPVFFFVGGYANAASLSAYRDRGGTAAGWLLGRTDRLVRPTTAFFAAIAVAAVAALALGVPADAVNTAVWLAAIPLWFLAAYFTVVLLTPVMLVLHRRAGLVVPVALVVLVGLGDLARLGFGLPQAALGNFVFAWLAVHQLGIAWREGALPARPRVALPLAAGGLAALVALTVAGPYPVSMVTVPGEEVQNTSPPTLALLALAAVQVGLALALRDAGERWLRRLRPWTVVVAVNSLIMTFFLWHMTAVVIAAVVLYPTGVMPQPPPGSAAWLLLRVPWVAVLAVVLAALVAVFGGVERRAGPRPSPGGIALTWRAAAVAGTAAVVAGLVLVALNGPGGRTPADLPIAGLVCYAAGAALLRTARRRGP